MLDYGFEYNMDVDGWDEMFFYRCLNKCNRFLSYLDQNKYRVIWQRTRGMLQIMEIKVKLRSAFVKYKIPCPRGYFWYIFC